MPRIVDIKCTECEALQEDVFTSLNDFTDWCDECQKFTPWTVFYKAPNIHVKNPDPARRGRGRG